MATPTRETILNAIDAYCRAETDQDRAAFMALFSPNIVHEDPVGTPPRRGYAGLAELWEIVVACDASLRLTGDVIVCGREAIALLACDTGPADARSHTAPIVDHFTFDDSGKIVSVRAFYAYG